eukprot:scaffold167_cov347-Prasinococcus_capsulatus_cf.AAC.10
MEGFDCLGAPAPPFESRGRRWIARSRGRADREGAGSLHGEGEGAKEYKGRRRRGALAAERPPACSRETPAAASNEAQRATCTGRPLTLLHACLVRDRNHVASNRLRARSSSKY